MDGGHAIEGEQSDAEFNLPAVLARLDGSNADAKRDAVEMIADRVDREPAPCLATVPKLRQVLTEPDLECHESVAYCLAELAEYSPVDVAPSAEPIVTFVANNPGHDATPELLRCLAAIARERTSAVADYADSIATALENDDPTARAAAARIIGQLTTAPEATVEAVDDRLETLAATDIDRTVRECAQWALDRRNERLPRVRTPTHGVYRRD